MSGEPTISEAKGKRLVREVIALARGYGISEKAITDKVNELARPDRAKIATVREWIEWNQHRGFITYRYNEDLEEDLWFLTERGQAKRNETLK
ncbi:hypothetical protein [Haloferula sargassicola]|uniref:Uncharacterized protein n=1 Tax=Haloferula sargassicola TaxID=490096 RepID=A0ABP9UKD9_9BACT